MFMFRKKENTVSTTAGLQKEAKKFQEAIAEINATYKPEQIDINLCEGIAKKYGIDIGFIFDTYQTYLKNNAINAIRQVKAKSDYTILHLDQAAAAYGYDLDSLNVTYFSKE